MEYVEREVQAIEISSLSAHPSQGELIADLSDAELTALAGDIQANGLYHPIEVTEDFTIVDGHQRVAAYQMLERETIPAWVRRDLQTPEDVERRFLEANVHRRQLTQLGQARACRRLLELASHGERCDLREELAARFKMSGRNLARLVRLLDLPPRLQQAIDDNLLSLRTASRALNDLTPAELDGIAEEVEPGKAAEDLVRSKLPQAAAASKRKPSFSKAAAKMMELLDTGEKLRPEERETAEELLSRLQTKLKLKNRAILRPRAAK